MIFRVQSSFTHSIKVVKSISQMEEEFTFMIPNMGSTYIDLENTELYIKVTSHEALGDEQMVLMSNNVLYTLFGLITRYLGPNQQEIYIGNFLYTSYMQQLMHFKQLPNDIYNEGLSIEIYGRKIFKNDFNSYMTRYN